MPDPTDSQSFNRYSYCHNNPLNLTDPTGFDDGDDTGGGDSGEGDSGDSDFGSGWIGSGWFGGVLSNNYDYSTFACSFNENYSNGTWSSSWSISYGGVGFSGNSGGFMFGGGYDATSIEYGDSISVSGLSHEYMPGELYDGAQMPGTYISQPFGNTVSTPAAIPAAATASGGNWLTTVTNVAGLLSALPIPVVSEVAGLVNAAGEASQGHYLLASVGVGTAVLAVVGLGSLGLIVKDATKAAKEVKATEEGIIYLRTSSTGGEYVGQAKNAARYAKRQAEHAAANPMESFTFQELERVPSNSGRSLNVAEEDWIRAGGGPKRFGGPLQNDRYQMNPVDYVKAGGKIPLP